MLNQKRVASMDLIKKELRVRYWQETKTVIPKDELFLEILNICE
jgi:hypothetical protein